MAQWASAAPAVTAVKAAAVMSFTVVVPVVTAATREVARLQSPLAKMAAMVHAEVRADLVLAVVAAAQAVTQAIKAVQPTVIRAMAAMRALVLAKGVVVTASMAEVDQVLAAPSL